MSVRWSLLALFLAVSAGGCSDAPAPVSPPTDSAAMAPAKEHSKEPLSAEDQALADKQKVCPVGGEPLGSMGTPVKVMVGDRAIFLCCEGCRDAVTSDPEKYLAKLDAAADPAAETPAAPASEAPTAPSNP